MRIKHRVWTVVVLFMAVLLLTEANVLAVSWVGGVVDPNTGIASWHVPANWSTGLVPVAGEKVQFTGSVQLPEAVISGAAVSGQTVLGDNGSDLIHRLRVANGGVWNASLGDWTAAGYNRTGIITVDRGGSMITTHRVGVGLVAADPTTSVSYLNVNGLADIGGTLQIGSINHKGIVNVNSGGLLKATGWEWRDLTGLWSFMDIGFGTVVINGNVTDAITGLITAKALTGFGGLTTPTAVYANGVTTITAPDPMNRAPVYKTVLAGDVDLTWTNLPPVAPATDIWVDVWFGTDPNKLSLVYSKVLTKGKNATSVTVNAPAISEPTRYYWQVDSYLKGDPAIVIYDAENPVTEGLVTPFEVTNNTPPSVVIDTPPTATWINEPIQLGSTLTDDHPEQVTYLWTSDVPNVVFLPSNSVANPTVTVDSPSGPFTVTVTVDDGFNPPASASVRHVCEADPCQAAVAVIGLNTSHPADIAVDCKINLADFAELAREWLTDYSLTNPVPVP